MEPTNTQTIMKKPIINSFIRENWKIHMKWVSSWKHTIYQNWISKKYKTWTDKKFMKWLNPLRASKLNYFKHWKKNWYQCPSNYTNRRTSARFTLQQYLLYEVYSIFFLYKQWIKVLAINSFNTLEFNCSVPKFFYIFIIISM